METKKFDLKKLTGSREMSLVVVLVLLCAFVQIRNSSFLTPVTLEDMFRNYSVTFILALGMMCVLLTGGVSLTGGRGSVTGVLLGALTITIIGKALPLIGVSQFWQNGIKGLIILVAVIINVMAQRTMDKKNRE